MGRLKGSKNKKTCKGILTNGIHIYYQDVICKSCGIVFKKQVSSLKAWKGNCKECDFKERSIKSIIKKMEKLSNTKKRKGPLNHMWKGGITPIISLVRNHPRYLSWRSTIFKRDKYTCKNCGKTKCYLEAHHIKSFSSIFYENKIDSVEKALACAELWDENNGVTLCIECHNPTKKGIKKIKRSPSWRKGKTLEELYGVERAKEIRKKNSEKHIGKSPANKGVSPTLESRKKMSIAHKGHIPWNKGIPCSEETRKRLQSYNLNRVVTDETRLKMGQAQKGRKHTEEAKNKIRLAKIGNKNPMKRIEVRNKVSASQKERFKRQRFQQYNYLNVNNYKDMDMRGGTQN